LNHRTRLNLIGDYEILYILGVGFA
jgi:hypothetical protein